MSDTPLIITLSHDPEKSSEQFLSEIQREFGPLSASQASDNSSSLFSFVLDTKYYSSNLAFASASPHSTVPAPSSVEAVLIYFNPKCGSSFSALRAWFDSYEDEFSSSLVLLLCDELPPQNDPLRESVMSLTVQNQLEIIELSPSEKDDDDEEIFGSVYGYQRVRKALEAHSWSNMVMKPRNPVFQQAENPSDGNAAARAESAEEDVELFDRMFSLLGQFRETADRLPWEDRKRYAETITKQFWTALGNESDEDSD